MGMVKEVLFYCNVSTKSVSKIPSRKIHYYDLTFVLKGKLTYIIDGKQYILHENDAVFLKPETLRERLVENHQTKYVSFNFLLNEDITIETFLEEIINDDIKKLISVFPQRHITNFFIQKKRLKAY